MKDLIIGLFEKFRRFIKFGITGVVNTIVTLGVYYILNFLGVNHIIANVAGYVAGSINGYIMSKTWVFKDTKATVKDSVLKYYTIYGSSLLIATIGIWVWVDILGISDKIAPLINLCITVPYNFFLQKIWAFKDKNDTEKDVENENSTVKSDNNLKHTD